MVERSWELMPYMDWYLYVDADTYVNWPNLSRWLAGLDPEERLYIGSPILLMQYPSTLFFAHGGAGIVLSGVVVREFAVEHKGIANKWDERVSKMWYGDAALARALHEDINLDLAHAQLSMTTDEPQNIAFREEIWCRPVLTLHHCKSEHLKELDQFERAYNSSSVATYRDLYAFFFPDGLPQNRENWHNMARDDGSLDWSATLDVKPKNKGTHLNMNLETLPAEHKDPHESFEGCRHACRENEHCYQFLFVTTVTSPDLQRTRRCYHSRVFRLGSERLPEVDESSNVGEVAKMWASGWMSDRIAQWVVEHSYCGTEDIIWPV